MKNKCTGSVILYALQEYIGEEKDLLYKERVYLNQEETTLQFELDQQPNRATIDPLRLLIDRIYDDNTKTVSLAEE